MQDALRDTRHASQRTPVVQIGQQGGDTERTQDCASLRASHQCIHPETTL